MTVEAFPLAWPAGRARTPDYHREQSRFDTTFARARDNVIREIKLLLDNRWRDPDAVISTNLALRRDGLPLANARRPEDPGVAVYFTYNGAQRCFACDRWSTIDDNMQAIAKTIEALRGIARWGTGDMLAAAFTGFTALPAPASRTWREVLGVQLGEGLSDARLAYRRAAAAAHPDRGGSDARMAEVNAAWAEAQRALS